MNTQKTRPKGKQKNEEAQSWRRAISRRMTTALVSLLAKTPVTPNMVTWTGMALSAVAAAFILSGQLVIGGIVVIVAGFFDMLDGALARTTNQVSRFGGVLDSTLDRLAEAVLLIGLIVYFASNQAIPEIIITGLALAGSFLVSYVRSRAEAIGIDCEVGIMTRPERVVLLTLGLLLSGINYVLLASLTIIMALSFITAGQRLARVWKMTRE